MTWWQVAMYSSVLSVFFDVCMTYSGLLSLTLPSFAKYSSLRALVSVKDIEELERCSFDKFNDRVLLVVGVDGFLDASVGVHGRPSASALNCI